MPKYDFRCTECGKGLRIFIPYADYDEARPACTYCGSTALQRRISRVALAKSEDARLDSLMDDPDLDALEGEDPRSLGRFMRRMSQDMGEDMGDEFNEVVERLEKGESPESIDASLPDLGQDLDDSF